MNFLRRVICLFLFAAMVNQPARAGLFGPSTDILQGQSLTAKLKSQPVVLSIQGGELDVRSKSAAVGSFLLGFVVSSALGSSGGSGGPMNAQQMQKNLQAQANITSAFGRNVQTFAAQIAADQAAKPKAQVAKDGPVVVIGQQLMAGLRQEPGISMSTVSDTRPAAPTDLQLRIFQPEWKLDFSMASSDYTLLYQVEVSLYQKDSDTVFFKDTCKGEASRKMPKEEWEKDDFSEVALAVADIGTRCVTPWLAALSFRPADGALRSPPSLPGTVVESTVPAPAAESSVSQVAEPSPSAAPVISSQK